MYTRTSIEQLLPVGRARRATVAITVLGMSDELVLDFRWGDDTASWSMVSSSQQKAQRASYSITAGHGNVSHVCFELLIDPAIPLPGFLVGQIMKRSVTTATNGLKQRVE